MTPSPSTAESIDTIEKQTVDHLFVLYPHYAVSLGLHQYDGRLPLVAREATDRWLAEARPLEARLASIASGEMPAGRRIDLFLLQLLLESARFDLVDSADLDRNPMAYFSALSLTSYIARDYAPVPDRVHGILRILETVPAYLDAGRRRLRPVLAKPFLTLALSMGSGLPTHFAEAEAFARRSDRALGDRVSAARHLAEPALSSFLEALRNEYLPRANDVFALGPERFQRLLFVREGLERPYSEVEKAGRADLERNQRRLDQIAREAHATIPQLLEGLYREHPAASDLIPSTRALVDGARRFVEEHALATVPHDAKARVEETPAWGRALSTASMDSPGPFDTTSGEGIYYVTPVDPQWSAQQQEEWLRSLNRTMLANITVHEVYPGHYLQFLHFRAAQLSLARKAYLSPSFVEGWAHYAEQLVIEEGFGSPGVQAEVAQIHDALLRDCRLLASIGLHTRGMTVEEATQLFQREAHFEQLPAEREAIRGTFNPEYFCYTLGKLAILEARKRYLQPKFGGSLRGFHDTLLGFGCPPIGVFDRLFDPASS
jgi:uncharacterized protein (DUF885 family)